MTTLILTNIDWCTEGQTRAACGLPEAVVVLDAPEISADDTDDNAITAEAYENLAMWLDEQFGFRHTGLCVDVLGITQNGMLPVPAGRWDVGCCTVLAYEKPRRGN